MVKGRGNPNSQGVAALIHDQGIPIQSLAGGSKNIEDPQMEQNPRRTFAED